MKVELGSIPPAAEEQLTPTEPDASGAGINYADAYLKVLKTTLDDGRKILCRRRGLKLTLTIGESQGESLMRRVEHGPDLRTILHQALVEAAANAGATFSTADGVVYLEID